MLPLRVYSTLSREVEDFTPLEEGQVKMYACGVTVYDEAHIGHARQAIVFDVIRNYLEYAGYKVTYVRNYTDVDDKIIARAQKLGRDPLELSEYYIQDTSADMRALKVRPATVEPKVTAHIPDIIDYIKDLVDGGYAYAGGGDVLFDVTKLSDYGKLSHQRLAECLNSDVSSHKRNPQDFALWKGAKPGEPAWDSPWGAGRPGWHIECSVMAYKYLGATLDIHGGGLDLIFPHHENEIAQSEARNHAQFARYWVHNGLVTVNAQKMSKSLGNFMSIKDALQRYHPDVIKFAVLSHHYTSEMDFSEETLKVAVRRVAYFYRTLAAIDVLLEGRDETQAGDSGLACDLMRSFEQSMGENFSTPQALAALSSCFLEVNKLLATKASAERKASELAPVRAAVTKITGIFAMLDEAPRAYLDQFRASFLREREISVEEVVATIQQRKEAKARKDYQAADAIRAAMLARGIALQDTPTGEVLWDVALE